MNKSIQYEIARIKYGNLDGASLKVIDAGCDRQIQLQTYQSIAKYHNIGSACVTDAAIEEAR